MYAVYLIYSSEQIFSSKFNGESQASVVYVRPPSFPCDLILTEGVVWVIELRATCHDLLIGIDASM